MSEIIKNKYLDFSGLKKYDELVKGLIASGNKELADAIAALDAKIGTIEFEGSDSKTLVEVIEDIQSSIIDIVENQGSLETKDSELEGKINEIVGDLELGESDSFMSLVEVANKLNALDASVSKNAQDIETLKGEGEGSVKKAAADAQAAAEATASADATSKADAARDAAKGYADSLVKDAEGKSLFDAAGAADAALADAKSYVDGKVDGKFDEAGAAAQALADAKADAASLYQVKGDYEAAGAADAALSEAKSYVDGKVDGKFDEAGAAAQALADAKADAASLYQVKGDYEAAGTAATLNSAMDERVKVLEAIDHEKLAADASAAAVAAIVAGAESDFDTLKEVEEWIGSHKEGAAELQTTVSGHTESINTLSADLSTLDTKVDQDIANLTDHMNSASTALGEVDGRLDAIEAFVEAHESIEISDIEGLFEPQE
jgi:hypothetical protein